MATKKNTKRKIVVQSVELDGTKEELSKTVVKPKELSDEDLFFGKEEEQVEVIEFNYQSEQVKYRITNLSVKNKPTIVNGLAVETFIGAKNIDARKAL